jgi:hypothetical protein
MPRTGKGPRQPSPTANRTDLLTAQAPGQGYGQRAQQQAAQQAVPLAPPAQAGGPSPSGGGATITPMRQPTGPMPQAAPPSPTPGTPGPGELTPLFAPTERPGEPVTAGIDQGPGPGRSALNAMPIGQVANNMAPSDSAAALLASLASRPDAGATIQNLARIAANGPIR